MQGRKPLTAEGPVTRHHAELDLRAPWTLLGDVETTAAANAARAVDDGETPGPSLDESAALSEDFHHAKWWSHRARVIKAMELAGESPRAITRVADCGKYATVQRCVQTGDLRIRGSRCKHRFCKRCGQATSLNVADNLGDRIKAAKLRCSHMVLTLKHRPGELAPIRKRLYSCFKSLRNTPAWKRCVRGGAAFCQMHRSLSSGMWHVHFHAIVEHHYLPQEELSDLWHRATGDSTNVWIERVDRIDRVVKEATRYVASPIDKTTAENVLDLAAAIAATKGARLCFTFGTWRGTKLHAKRPEDPTLQWVTIAYLGDVLWQANHDDAAAKQLLAQLLRSEISATGPPTLYHQL